MQYYVYIARCADETLYAGITTNIDRRMAEHNRGIGAKYTRTRRPVVCVFVQACKDRSSASKLESAIKKLSRAEKLALIQGRQNQITSLNE